MKLHLFKAAIFCLLILNYHLIASEENILPENEGTLPLEVPQNVSPFEQHLDDPSPNDHTYICNFSEPESGRIAFQAELLVFRPSREQASYVITSTDNRFMGEVFPNGKRHLNPSHYSPGFRVEGIYELCNRLNYLDFRFTYFNAGNSAAKRGDFLFDTIGFPGDGAQAPEDTTYAGRARIKDHYELYAGEANFHRLSLDCCPENLSFLVGLHYAYIKFREIFSSTGSYVDNDAQISVSNHLTRRSNFWGIGPQFGVDYHYIFRQLGCFGTDLLSLNISGRGALLCSNTDSTLHYRSARTSNPGVNMKSTRLWRVTPTANARASLSYHFSCFNMEGALELGYELLWYSKCLNSITGIDVAYAGDTIDVFNSLSLQGPFIALTVAF